MHRHPWISLVLVIGIAAFHLSPASNAATLIVMQDGSGDATTINAALEMLDYNDGEDDVVLIGPGVYDEQIKPKGNAGVDSTAYPTIFDLTLERLEATYSSHPDHLTLEGIESATRSVVTVEEGAIQQFGFDPENPNDFMETTLVLCGNEITYKNLEFRHSGVTGYAMNGQASGIIFEDCLFTNATSQLTSHDDFCSYQFNPALTSIINATVSADNEYTFTNCLMEGRSTIDDSLYDSAFAWFHGYDDIPELSIVEPVGGVTISGCIARNWEDRLHEFRGRTGSGTGLAFTLIQDSYFENIFQLFEWRGAQGPAIFNRNVVNGIAERGYAVRVADRDLRMPPELVVSNNLIIGPGGRNATPINLSYNDDPLLPENDCRVTVVNNTFHDYAGNGVRISGTSTRGETIIANNVFSAGDFRETDTERRAGILIQSETVHIEVFNNLFFNNLNHVLGTPTLETNNLTADPEFYSTSVSIPSAPGEKVVQGFLPFALAATEQGSATVYNDIRTMIADHDVDGDTREIETIDIGTHWIGNLPPTNTPTATPSPTFTDTPTITPTPTFTPTPTATPTPTNPPPSAPTVIIEPEEPFTFDDLICNATGSVDPDGGDVSYLYKWFRDGVDLTIENETDFSGPLVPAEETVRDQTWRCEVTVRDDEGESNFGGAEVFVQNSLPTQPEIKVLPANPLPGDGRAVLLLTFSFDADNDGVVYLFQWFRLDSEGEWQLRPEVSGTLRPYSPGQAEISGLYTAGETWKVEVTPYEARSLVKRNNDAKGSSGVIAGLTAVEQWIVLPDFGNDGMIDSADILTLLELWRSDAKAFAPETYPDLIFVSTLGWQGKAEEGN